MDSEGKSIAQTCKKPGVSEQTFHRWRRDYGSSSTDQVRRLQHLERGLDLPAGLLQARRLALEPHLHDAHLGVEVVVQLLGTSRQSLQRKLHVDGATLFAESSRAPSIETPLLAPGAQSPAPAGIGSPG